MRPPHFFVLAIDKFGGGEFGRIHTVAKAKCVSFIKFYFSPPMSDNTWSARFDAPLNAQVARFNASVRFDQRLAEVDIIASIAHAEMLAAQNIISNDDGSAIVSVLRRILTEVKSGDFDWREEDEDVHFNIERRLIELAGDAGKKLHTARSRNDQVATDLRLFLRGETDILLAAIKEARWAILAQAEQHAETLMPGMTHLQIAQPVTFGHHLLAYDEMLARDAARFADARRRLNKLPLGAGALAGVGYPIDRARVAAALGFDGVCENSIDAVSDRDFAVEYASASALLMSHLSRLCEEIILWSSPAFAFVELSDSFCTGSSIMPQKKNPDVPELMRGKCGRVFGALNALLVLGKSQPLAYNKDNQEDKEPLFDCVDTVRDCVSLLSPMLSAMTVKPANMRRLLELGYPTATELADYLTRCGMPFRDAHAAVSALVQTAEKSGRALEALSLSELREQAPLADAGALEFLKMKAAVCRRDHIGGTAPTRVLAQIKKTKAALSR